MKRCIIKSSKSLSDLFTKIDEYLGYENMHRKVCSTPTAVMRIAVRNSNQYYAKYHWKYFGTGKEHLSLS